jgi:uncharacterized spore protein YtfJ
MDTGYEFAGLVEKIQAKSNETFDRLMSVAEVDKVFSQPVVSGEYTVITAAEVGAGLGLGFGVGAGMDEDKDEAEEPKEVSGSGGGGGGGGGSFSRPVAVITISPQGVEVKPVIDITKISLACFTALGSMVIMFARMGRFNK